MKKKLKTYSNLFISFSIVILVIALYYSENFYLASVILIIYICYKGYIDTNRELYNKEVNTLTDKIKAKINDNISNMILSISFN